MRSCLSRPCLAISVSSRRRSDSFSLSCARAIAFSPGGFRLAFTPFNFAKNFRSCAGVLPRRSVMSSCTSASKSGPKSCSNFVSLRAPMTKPRSGPCRPRHASVVSRKSIARFLIPANERCANQLSRDVGTSQWPSIGRCWECLDRPFARRYFCLGASPKSNPPIDCGAFSLLRGFQHIL